MRPFLMPLMDRRRCGPVSPSGNWCRSTRIGRRSQPFDRLQIRPLFAVAERHGDARRPGPAGAADAVDVRLRLVRQVVVDHVRDAVDVDAARGHVGRHQHRRPVALEVRQRSLPGVLALVAVDRLGPDAGLFRCLTTRSAPCLVAREDERPRACSRRSKQVGRAARACCFCARSRPIARSVSVVALTGATGT